MGWGEGLVQLLYFQVHTALIRHAPDVGLPLTNVLAQAAGKDMGAFRQRLFDLYDKGELQAWVDEQHFHGVEQVSDAIEYMLSGQALGKVVVSF